MRTPPTTEHVAPTQRGSGVPGPAGNSYHDFSKIDPSKRKTDRELNFAKALRQSKNQEILTKKRTLGRPEV
jgi:hypothetical protein